MSKVVKAIGKVASGIVSGVKKAYKAVTGSSIGRTLLLAGTVYLGGAALGMWDSPFDSINGMFSNTAPVAKELGSAADGSLGDVAGKMSTGVDQPSAADRLLGGNPTDNMLASAGGPTLDVPNAPEASAAQAAIGGPASAAQAAPVQPSIINSTLDADDAEMGGDMSRFSPFASSSTQATNAGGPTSMMDKVLNFYKGDFAKAALTQQVGGAIKGAFTPNARQLAEAQYDARRRYDLQRQADQAANYNVGGVRVVTPAAGAPQPGGLINRALG